MKTLVCTALLALHFFSLSAQQEECFARFLEEGLNAANSGRYKEALDRYEAANMCLDKDERMIDSLMERSKFQLDSALAAFKLLNKINTIISNALRLKSENPTLALRLAHEACNLSKNKIDLAVETRQSILNDAQNGYYSFTKPVGCEVVGVAVAPDGRSIYVGCYKDGIKRYDIETDELTQLALPDSDEGMYSLTLSPDGDKLLAGYDDGSVWLWNTDGNLLSQGVVSSNERVWGTAFSPSGDTIAVTSVSGHLVVWNSNDLSLEPNTTKLFPDALYGISFLPDGKSVIVASRDFTSKIIDLRTLREETLSGHTQLTFGVSVSLDGKWVASASNDKTLRLWDANSKKALRSMQGHNSDIKALAFANSSRRAASADVEGIGRVWDLNGNCLKELRGHEDEIWAIAFAPDDSYIVTGSLDETIRIWRNALRDPFADVPHSNAIISAIPSPDGKYILTGSLDMTAKLWSRTSRTIIWNYTAPDQIISCAISPDGRYALLGLWNGEDHLLDLESGVLLKIYQGHSSSLYSVGFSPDSKRIVTCSRDNTAKCWTLDGAPVCTIMHTDRVSCVAFSPDGKKIVSGSWDKTVKISTIGSRYVKTVTLPSAISAVSYHPDGKKILVSGENGLCRLIDDNGKTITDFGHPKAAYQVYSSAFSFSGDTVFTGSDDGRIRAFLLNGTLINEEHGHTGTVYSVRPVPKTNLLLTAGKEGRARLWRIDDGLSSFRVFRGHVTEIDWAQISSADNTVITGRDDGQFKYWESGFYDGTTLIGKSPKRVTAFTTPLGSMDVVYGGQTDGRIVRWEKSRTTQTPGDFIRLLSGKINSLDCTLQGDLLIAGTADSVAYLLNDGGKILKKRNFGNAVSAVGISTDGSFALAGYQGASKFSSYVALWDWKRDSILWSKMFFSDVTLVAFNQDNSMCAIAAGGSITFYHKDGRFVKRIYENTGNTTSFSFSRDSRFLLSVNKSGGATVWDATDEQNAVYPLLTLNMPNGDTIVAAGFASYPKGQSTPREIMLCGQRSGPIFYPFALTELEGENSDVEKLTAEQRRKYGIEFDFEGCFASDNLEEVRDCAEFFSSSYLNDYDDEAFGTSEKLFRRLINESSQEDDRRGLSDLYATKITRLADTKRPNKYNEIIRYSGEVLMLAQQDSAAYPESSEKMDALFSAYWNHSWYLLLAGKFPESLQAATAGLAVPSDNEQKEGIASNKALALLLTAPTYEEAKTFYDEWKERPWVDYRHPKFRGAFLDDFVSLKDEGTYETLTAEQKRRISLMEAQLKLEEEKEKDKNGN